MLPPRSIRWLQWHSDFVVIQAAYLESHILCWRSKEIFLLDARPCLAFFDTKDLGCLVFQELCWSFPFGSFYLKKDTYRSESFWSAAGGTIVAEASNMSRWPPLNTRGCIAVYNATFRDRRRIHWPRILRMCKVTKLRRWILRKKLTWCWPDRQNLLHSSSADPEDSDPIDFDNEMFEALVHLDHAPTPPTIVKISPILPSSKSSPPASLVAVRMIHLMKIWLVTMVTVIVAVTKTRMTVESCLCNTFLGARRETPDVDWR